MNQYNWDEIYKLSVEMLNPPKFREILRISGSLYLRDLRTLHMGGGRQNGCTSWVVKEICNSPDSLMVVVSKTMKDFLKNHPRIREVGHQEGIHDRVFTSLDIASMLRTKTDEIVEKLKKADRIFVDDASYGKHLSKTIELVADYVRPEVIIVAMK